MNWDARVPGIVVSFTGYAHAVVGSASHIRRLRVPVILTLVVTLAGAFATTPIRDTLTAQQPVDTTLLRPLGYVLLAPFSEALDALTLLSAHQHAALVLGALIIWALIRVAQMGHPKPRLRAHLTSLTVLICTFGLAYVAAAVCPRPMAQLVASDPDTVRVDFHSHTNRSGDARRSFSLEANRQWHRDGGYDVAYVTDHGVFTTNNVATEPPGAAAGSGLVSLNGSEVAWSGEHVGLLGSEQACRAAVNRDLRTINSAATLGRTTFFAPPVMIWNHAHDGSLKSLPAVRSGSGLGVHAIEVANGAPRGRDEVWRNHQAIVEFALRYDLALTSGSDSHGWGQTAPNWSLLHIPGWRALDSKTLSIRIQEILRTGGISASRVVERTVTDAPSGTASLAFTVVELPWRILTTLSPVERLSFVAWIWSITGMVVFYVKRQRPSGSGASSVLGQAPG